MEYADVNRLVEAIQDKLSAVLYRDISEILVYFEGKPDLLHEAMTKPDNGCSEAFWKIV